ncbi:sulfite exporter TauE/SafE family protein [Hansschlegelia zhihuaiae]|uniref:Probable membrane transporter protein n=1 Tax=Hansschlegelia zhihuaiae TaxID=405005 RepID=A0A4Q0M5M9_9HYPH|nr:sulfite exporter TauE/SafE family protein [Hansschlegelia zhihuaiae]RXF68265.1 sulfite exporter TauE/SafE family protein [Hansschlegelia zhihuaiae]
MSDPSFAILLFVFSTFMVAGLVKGVTGMGLPTVAMGLLATQVPPHEAASLLLLPSLLTNLLQLAAGPDPVGAMRRFWPMMTAVAIGALATAGLLAGDAARHATAALGAVLVVYALFGLSGRRLVAPLRAERWLAAPVGFVTGAITGATGVFVLPAVPYLQALGLEKEDLVQALGLSFTVSTIALGLGLALSGGLEAHSLGGSAAAVAPAFLGMAIGQRLRHAISPDGFRLAFFAGLLGLGLYLARGG